MNRPFDGLHTRARGRLGEDEAERFLVEEGYRIVLRNFSCRSGEIDIIAEEDGVLCFVEIKARASREYGEAIESLSRSKMRRISKAASYYLLNHPDERPCRFDLVAMDLQAGQWRFTLVRNAFEAH